jgi:4-amino-4-deoxy-L-arabinose transferase-like glycosyltransferase
MDTKTKRTLQPALGRSATALIYARWLDSKYGLIAAYGLALIVIVLATPLQVPELLAIGWSIHRGWAEFWNWGVQASDPSPLGNLIQAPFVLLFGPSRLGVRLPGLLFALGSAPLWFRLGNRTTASHARIALLLFVFFPMQLLAVAARVQFEAATFFVLLATLAFFALIEKPGFRAATLLAVATAACLFTDRHAILPIVGAVFSLLRFSERPQERNALWFALGACVCAVAAYVPYYLWAKTQVSSHWLSEPNLFLPVSREVTFVHLLLSAVATPVIFAGICIGGYASFRLPLSRLAQRVTLFCLFGSAVLTIGLILGIGLYDLTAIPVRDLVYAAPATLVLLVAGYDWGWRQSAGGYRRMFMRAPAALLVLFALVDISFAFGPKQNLTLESRYVEPQVTRDSCVVFVSGYFSRTLFLLSQPTLKNSECQDFFHRRVVLASHPYVSTNELAEAEGVFKGLNFREVRRIRIGRGEIVVYENR